MDKQIWTYIEAKIKENAEQFGKELAGADSGEFYFIQERPQKEIGFWPGLLWKGYQITENETYAMLARELEADFDEKLFDASWIDQYCGAAWTLISLADFKLTGSLATKNRALAAANFLMSRFNLAGDFIRFGSDAEAEDTNGMAAIDSILGMPLLFWAAAETGDPRYKHIAEAHLTTIIYHFIKEDGSVYPVRLFDPETGVLLEEKANLPKNRETEGEAYAVYGFALAARYTRRPEYLDASRLIAGFLLEEKEEHPDRSDPVADAVFANGLLTLAKLTGEEEYRKEAELLVSSLYERRIQNQPSHPGMIAVQEKEGKLWASLTADYFFAEAAASLIFNNDLFW